MLKVDVILWNKKIFFFHFKFYKILTLSEVRYNKFFVEKFLGFHFSLTMETLLSCREKYANNNAS